MNSRFELPMRLRPISKVLRSFRSDARGVAAIEFSLFALMLGMGVVNVADVSIYFYQRMQAENATQSAAQAAWKACDPTQLPATSKCPALASVVQAAVGGSSLTTRVTLIAGSPSEGYYCVTSTNTLQYMSDMSSKPTDCSATGMPGVQPGDYIQIKTTFAYAPIFPGLSVASTFPTPINSTATMRLL